MSWLLREIERRAKVAEETLLGGAAPNYDTYLRINERYQVLKELILDVKARNDAIAKGDEEPDDDD